MNDDATTLASTRYFALPPRSSLAAATADPDAPLGLRRDPTGPQTARGQERAPSFSLTLPRPPAAHRLLVALPGGGQAKSPAYRRWLRQAQAALRDQRRIYLGGRVAISVLCPRGPRGDLAGHEKAPVALLVGQGLIDDARNVESLGLAWHDGQDLIVTVRKA